MPNPQEREGFSRDKDLERVRGDRRPADADMDASDRRADRKPEENIDFPADADDEDEEATPPDRETLADSGQ